MLFSDIYKNIPGISLTDYTDLLRNEIKNLPELLKFYGSI
jgi:hypothetical protein